jgi:hypothetical protein
MNNSGIKIRESLYKRLEALKKFRAGKEAFLIRKKQITKDIEEAREIWAKTLEQLPNLPF